MPNLHDPTITPPADGAAQLPAKAVHIQVVAEFLHKRTDVQRCGVVASIADGIEVVAPVEVAKAIEYVSGHEGTV